MIIVLLNVLQAQLYILYMNVYTPGITPLNEPAFTSQLPLYNSMLLDRFDWL